MTENILTIKQQNVYDLFKKLGLTEVTTTQASFSTEKDLYRIDSPRIFKVGNTSNLLVFGEIKKSLSYEQLQAFLEEQLKKSKEKSPDQENLDKEEETEIDGEQSASDMLEKLDLKSNPKLKEEDIKFLIDETKSSREEAVQSLIKCDYDVISALVDMNKGK